MLAIEHTRPNSLFGQSYALDSNVQAPYPGLDMDTSYDSYDSMSGFHPLPFSYYENPTMFASAPAQAMKSQITRSHSQNSVHQYQQQNSELPPALISSASNASIPSATSSTVGSPYSGPINTSQAQDTYVNEALSHGLGLLPTIVNQDGYQHDFVGSGFDTDMPMGHDKMIAGNFVDPSLISGPTPFGNVQYGEQPMFPPQPQSYSSISETASPAPSPNQYPQYRTQFSPPITNDNFAQQQSFMSRRPSIGSHYDHSYASPSSQYVMDDDSSPEKGRCPHPDCGKVFKDLKAHMLTHQAERPEKCPILTCEYNSKGFARKYDKNRHTLTHYKGTMVCGFCPGSGSAAEKSFNRADVFKRHLTSVHGVEQTPPNSRKRSPTSTSSKKLTSYCQDATGKCSTCSATFSNAQDFYEHLDDCVLRVVQQEEPSEAINAAHLNSVTTDASLQETMDRHMIKTEEVPSSFGDEEEADSDSDDEDNSDPRHGKGSIIKSSKPAIGARAVIGANIQKPQQAKKNGMTWSKGGVALVGKGRKKRKHYPPSWGMSAEKMQMKKRVLCVYDGERRLWKDDMMLHNEFEVRMKLPGEEGGRYVTDLDVETLKRAEGFHAATEQERGNWVDFGAIVPQQQVQQQMMLGQQDPNSWASSSWGEVELEELMA